MVRINWINVMIRANMYLTKRKGGNNDKWQTDGTKGNNWNSGKGRRNEGGHYWVKASRNQARIMESTEARLANFPSRSTESGKPTTIGAGTLRLRMRKQTLLIAFC